MDIINKKDFDAVQVKDLPIISEGFNVTDEELESLIAVMDTPIEAMKVLAAQIKVFLDKRIMEEIKTKGILSDHTRRWVETYNDSLDRIQKAIYGEKSVNLHLHKITHSQIAAKIREASQYG